MQKTPKLGQHFLTDHEVIDRMADFAELKSDDFVLEIGPGQGILTEKLIASGAQVEAIEKDKELFYLLKKRFAKYPNFSLELGDIRSFDYENLPKGYKIVANIPYYLTGQLITRLTEVANKPKMAILMVQKEVAERLTAPMGEASLLELTTQVFAETEFGWVVPKTYFNPPPKVNSAVVKFKFRAKPLIAKDEQTAFFRILKFAFAGKRKKLTNTLGSALQADKNVLLKLLANQKLSENSRPQELTLKQWISLYKDLVSHGLV